MEASLEKRQREARKREEKKKETRVNACIQPHTGNFCEAQYLLLKLDACFFRTFPFGYLHGVEIAAQ